MRACVGQHLSCQSSHMSIIAVEQVLAGGDEFIPSLSLRWFHVVEGGDTHEQKEDTAAYQAIGRLGQQPAGPMV